MFEDIPDFDVSEGSEPLMSEEERQIARDLIEAGKNLLEFEKAVHAFDEQKAAIESDRKKLREQMDILAAADRKIQGEQFDLKRKLREAKREAEKQEGLLRQARQNKELAAEFARQRDEFDRLTLNAPWREWAMNHQIEGAKILANARKAILGDKRGLGKTLTSLIYADMLQAKKVLIIVPGDVIRTFEREIEHWAPHREIATLGKQTKRGRQIICRTLAKMDSYIVTINYEAWRRDKSLLQDLINLRFDTVILDEAHNIKDRKSIAFKGCETIVFGVNQCPECQGGPVEIAPSATNSWLQVPTCRNCGHAADQGEFNEFCSVKNVLPMTGTPILNKPQDLFTLLSLIDRTNFYDEYQYLRWYCEQDLYTGKWKFASGGLERLIKKMSSKFLVRDRHMAGITIPKQEEQIYELELDPEVYDEQYKYAMQLNKYAQILLDENTAMSILYVIALITRKRQMMTWPEGIKWTDNKTGETIMQVSCKQSVKVDRIIQWVNTDVNEWQGLIPELTADGSMEEGERVVVFSQFKEPLKELERRCQEAGISAVRYDGDTSPAIADEVVVDFDRKYCESPEYNNGNGPKWQVVLANYKKGGVGLNLTAATQVIILDEEWNPGKVDQAYGRVDRMGQTEETTVHVLRVKNSIDTWMASLISEKKEMIDGFESQHNLAQEMLDAIRKGEML